MAAQPQAATAAIAETVSSTNMIATEPKPHSPPASAPTSSSVQPASSDTQTQTAHPLLSGAQSWQLSAPRTLGRLLGSAVDYPQHGLHLYGTDLGSSFEHDGRVFMLFGDTHARLDNACDLGPGGDDDSMATLPVGFQGKLPEIEFFTEPEAAQEFRPVHLFRGEQAIVMSAFKVPVAGFSDGRDMFGLFQHQTAVPCDAAAANPGCPAQAGVQCAAAVATCQPAPITVPHTCELVQSACVIAGCTEQASVCVDTASSQYDGTARGVAASVLSEVDIGRARAEDPSTFDSLVTWQTNRFSHPNVRSVAKWSGTREGSDYAPGTDTLLLWGRPGMIAEQGREARLYFATQRLPITASADWQPQYFAGVDSSSGEPRWSADAADALPLALDGQPHGDAHEDVSLVNTTSVSWLGAPVNRWIMMYGGDITDVLLADPAGTRLTAAPGAIMVRFAEHPWGPWSAAVPHMLPGAPTNAGDAYGPGGVLFHPDCKDDDNLRCAQSDPYTLALAGGCIGGQPSELGRLYAPNIIDSYTKANARGGVDFAWVVSTWNPYGMVLMQSALDPAGTAPPALEPSSAPALQRLSSWRALPTLDGPGERAQASSSARSSQLPSGQPDANNFVCAGGSATELPFHFDEPSCAESYVRGAVLARVSGAGHMARAWLAPAGTNPERREILRFYVDDVAEPTLELPLAAAMDGSAGEIFAPPFGAGAADRLAWYYPVAFTSKLIVALDQLDAQATYVHEVEAVLDASPATAAADQRLPERDAALRQLSDVFAPAGGISPLMAAETLALEPQALCTLQLPGPATVYALRVRAAESAVTALGQVRMRVRWDGASTPAIDVALSELLAAAPPPDSSSIARSSLSAPDGRSLVLKLPMPFASSARFELENTGASSVRFELNMQGEQRVPEGSYGFLHTQSTPAADGGAAQTLAHATGRGRLVGVCAHVTRGPGLALAGPDTLDASVKTVLDGVSLMSPSLAAYADAPRGVRGARYTTPFAQGWGAESLAGPSDADFCRWHVLGGELDFTQELDLSIALAGQAVDRVTTTAFLYLPNP